MSSYDPAILVVAKVIMWYNLLINRFYQFLLPNDLPRSNRSPVTAARWRGRQCSHAAWWPAAPLEVNMGTGRMVIEILDVAIMVICC